MSADALRAARRFWQLPSQRLEELLALIRIADTVELKLATYGRQLDDVCARLQQDCSEAMDRRVWFLDTAGRQLEHHGVVARVRSIHGKPDDAVIKLRPFDPGRPHSRYLNKLRVEIDTTPHSYVCTAAVKQRLGHHDVQTTVDGGRPLGALFSTEQLTLLTAHAPVSVDNLMLYGPVDVRRARVAPAGMRHALTIQQWHYPDGTHLTELSARCKARDAPTAAAQTAAMLARHGVSLTSTTRTKTRAALDFFGGLGQVSDDG